MTCQQASSQVLTGQVQKNGAKKKKLLCWRNANCHASGGDGGDGKNSYISMSLKVSSVIFNQTWQNQILWATNIISARVANLVQLRQPSAQLICEIQVSSRNFGPSWKLCSWPLIIALLKIKTVYSCQFESEPKKLQSQKGKRKNIFKFWNAKLFLGHQSVILYQSPSTLPT